MIQWIDIKERRPRNGADCIVLRSNGDVSRAKRNQAWIGGFCWNGFCIDDVTWWIPFGAIK